MRRFEDSDGYHHRSIDWVSGNDDVACTGIKEYIERDGPGGQPCDLQDLVHRYSYAEHQSLSYGCTLTAILKELIRYVRGIY